MKRACRPEHAGDQVVMLSESEDTLSLPSSHVVLDQVDVTFDEQRSVPAPGCCWVATPAERLGIEQAFSRTAQ